MSEDLFGKVMALLLRASKIFILQKKKIAFLVWWVMRLEYYLIRIIAYILAKSKDSDIIFQADSTSLRAGSDRL